MATTRVFPLSVRVVTLAFVSCMFGSAQSPVLQKFVGVWELDDSTLDPNSFINLRFQRASDGGLEELRGPEAKPIVELVNFGAKPYSIDGSTNTIAWKQIDPSHFERKLFDKGKLQNIRRIEITADGMTLTEVTESTALGGQKGERTAICKRISGEPQGLVGVWKTQSLKRKPSPTMRYELVGTGELKVTQRGAINESRFMVKMDDTPVPVTGKTVISGTMIAFRVVDDHTLESTTTRNGVVTGKETLSLSNNGKVITSTTTLVGPKGNEEPTRPSLQQTIESSSGF